MRRRKKTRSIGEKMITEFLDLNNIIYSREKTWDGCRSQKNRFLRFDFYIPELNLLIEFQGQHHYHPINKYPRAKAVHLKTVMHDNIKRKFCNDNGILLLEIPYWDRDNIPNILQEQLK